MNKTTRKAVIAGNWKMNKTPGEARELIAAIEAEIKTKDVSGVEIVAAVPFVDLPAAAEAAKGTSIKIGAQNVHWAASGAFTGEISVLMLKEIGAEYVVLGHSERRQYFGETDLTVNARVKAALEGDLKVIFCVGELLEERELGITEEVVSRQVKVGLKDISVAQMQNLVIAYEPVWAIGTGKTATSEQAEEVCGAIRRIVSSLYGETVGKATSILYGGSMNAKNADELLSKTNVDGGLIGGASLKAADFARIIAAAI